MTGQDATGRGRGDAAAAVGDDEARARFVEALMARMTLEEKVGQLVLAAAGEGPMTGATGEEDLETRIAAGRVGSVFGTKSCETVARFQGLATRSRLGIPLLFAEDVIHGHRTLFPLPIGLASTWDMDLVEEVSACAAAEAAAEGIHQAYAPMLDICRDARWGRVAESPGEDPYLASRYGEAVVRGFQGDDPAAPGRLSACLKHFVGYGAPMGGRDYDAAEIGVPTLFDVYAAPFAAGLAAGAQAVMPGFHALNGVPLHAHGPLIEDWLRRERGFEGIVVSDYTAIAELTAHGIGNRDARVVRALLAGVDCDMVSGDYMAVLPRLAETGLTDPDTGLDISSSTIRVAIERACARVLTLKHRLALFEDPMHGATPGVTPGAPPAPTPATRALARRAAAASAVLLANDDVLPLAPGQRLALIGPLGDDRANMLGTWAVSGDPTTPGTIREGLVAAGFDTAFAPGSPVEDDPAIIDRLNFVPGTVTPDPRDAETLMAEAEALVATADTVVLVVGEAKEHTGECASRLAPVVPAAQARLARRIQALARARAKPVVLVVLAGRPLALEDLEDGADALLYAWFAGTEMGNGLADLLSGRAEPTGRLAISLPAHPGQTPIHHGAPETGRPWPGHWQKFTTNYIDQPDDEAPGRGRWPFGHGLGYAPLSFSAPTVERTVLNGPADRARIRVAVANMGERPSTAVVQLYVSDPAARIQRPSQELKGFQRLTLAPSQTGEVTFTLGAEDLAYTIEGADGRPVRVWDPGAVIVRTGPNAVDTQAITLRWKP